MTDSCSLLNSQAYSTLWIPSTTQDTIAFPLIASNGIPSSFLAAVSASTFVGSSNVLQGSAGAGSSDPIIQYLSNKQLVNVILQNGASARETLVDSYIAPKYNGSYTYAKASSSLPDSAFYTATDIDSTGAVVATPASIVGRLVKNGYLLTVADTQNLISLYQADQKGQSGQAAQLNTQSQLESKNMRFFAAFLVEYCFYRTRYMWLLSKYFTVYTQPPASYASPPAGTAPFSLFSGQGVGDNQYGSATALSQADYLKGITYQLACINTRMTDMKRLLTSVNVYYDSIYTILKSTLNGSNMIGSNAKLTATIKNLQKSTESSMHYMQDADFKKGVVEYTEEKNRYSSILLGLYAFLNISAIAVVFHLSKN